METSKSQQRRRLIRNREIVEDTWQQVQAEGPLPEGRDGVIVPLERWSRERQELEGRPGGVGVLLRGEDDARALAGSLEGLELIALDFAKFADGRGYSHAYILRHHLGYQGEIRAVGDVLRDQLHHMERCGINAFAVREDKELEDALKAFSTYSVSYQQPRT